MEKRLGNYLGLSLAVLALGACPMDDDDDGGGDASTGPMTSAASSSDSGTVESSGGSTTLGGETGDSSDGASGSSESGAGTFSVSGGVTRTASAVIAEGNDGVGTLFVGALTACDLTAPIASAGNVVDADFSVEGEPVPYEVPALPDGTYQLALFLDDNGDADPTAPAPGPGDIVYRIGDEPDGILSCIEVTIDGADLDAIALELTGTVPG